MNKLLTASLVVVIAIVHLGDDLGAQTIEVEKEKESDRLDSKHKAMDVGFAVDGFAIHGADSVFVQFETSSYVEKVKTLKYDLKQAKEIAINRTTYALFRNVMVKKMIANHRFIVDDWYLFPFPPRGKNDIPITGSMVNGKTGETVVRLEYRALRHADVPRDLSVKWRRLLGNEPERSFLP